MDFIDRLREKSAGTKKKIAYATSAVVTLAIFGVWVSVLHFGGSSKLADTTSNVTAAVANSSDTSSSDGSGTDVNPFSAFWSVLSTGWDGLSKNINQIKTDVGNAKDVVNTLGNTVPTSTSGVTVLEPAAQPAVQPAVQPTVQAQPSTQPSTQPTTQPVSQNGVFILDGSAQ